MNSYFFIDGFNIYHVIKKTFAEQKYKWLNLRKFCEQFAVDDEYVKEVLFFTAYAWWDIGKVSRHKAFSQALSHKGVSVIKGRFKKVSRNFNKKMDIVYPDGYVFNGPDKIIFQTFEEKETDVNIAIKMFEYAMNKDCQKIYLVSADSDLIPAVKAIKRNFPHIHIVNLLPIECKPSSLGRECHSVVVTNKLHFTDMLMEEEIIINDNFIIKMPEEWK